MTTLLLVGLLSGLTSCKKKVGVTTVEVEDPVRHYYPVVAGDELSLTYRLTNVGTEPLVIDDVQPSCGCIVADVPDGIVPPGDDLLLRFTYDSSKNVGYVRHVVRLFGNIVPDGVVSLVFDVNVVPPSDNVPDYEERHRATLSASERSDGGYYVDAPAPDPAQ